MSEEEHLTVRVQERFMRLLYKRTFETKGGYEREDKGSLSRFTTKESMKDAIRKILCVRKPRNICQFD